MLPFPLSRVKRSMRLFSGESGPLPHIPTSDPEFNLLIRYGLFFSSLF